MANWKHTNTLPGKPVTHVVTKCSKADSTEQRFDFKLGCEVFCFFENKCPVECSQSSFLIKTSGTTRNFSDERKRGPKNSRVSNQLKNYNLTQFYKFFNVLRASGESHFLPRPLFWDKTSQRDSSKRKSKTFLYSNKFSGDLLLGKTLPRQGAFRMTAPLSELYIAGSTFTVCIKLNKKTKSFKFIEHVN